MRKAAIVMIVSICGFFGIFAGICGFLMAVIAIGGGLASPFGGEGVLLPPSVSWGLAATCAFGMVFAFLKAREAVRLF